ncbi:MAG: cytochrome c4 [Rhizobiales bacterium]|nr:cytochrome c4 [Hyphomicrobiales bacterium]
MLIKLYLDDQPEPFRELTKPSEHFELDTTKLPDGRHILHLVTIEDGKVTGRRDVAFDVRNGPGIALAGLREGDVVRGEIPLVGNASGGSVGIDLRRVETHRGLPLWVGILALGVVLAATVLAALDPFDFRNYRSEADAIEASNDAPPEPAPDESATAEAFPVTLVEGEYMPVLAFDATTADPGRGEALYKARCIGCHGTDAAGQVLPKATLGQAGIYPRLAGQPAAYLYRQLVSFAEGTRDSTEMKPMASSLSQAQRGDVAVYLAQLQAPLPAPQAIEKDMRDLGRDVAVNGRPERGVNRCDGCHGESGLGVAPHFPALIAQNRGYLIGQFEAWRDGKRRNSLLELMLPVVHGLDEEEMWAIAAYYETVRP